MCNIFRVFISLPERSLEGFPTRILCLGTYLIQFCGFCGICRIWDWPWQQKNAKTKQQQNLNKSKMLAHCWEKVPAGGQQTRWWPPPPPNRGPLSQSAPRGGGGGQHKGQPAIKLVAAPLSILSPRASLLISMEGQGHCQMPMKSALQVGCEKPFLAAV